MKNINSNNLQTIPGVGKSIAEDMKNIGIHAISDLKDQDPQELYDKSNKFAGYVQDRCLLYVFREAVYFSQNQKHDPEKLKWWNWKDKKNKRAIKTNLKNDNYTIVIGTKNFKEKYFKDKEGWLKISARGNKFRMTAEQVLNHLLPLLAGKKTNLTVEVKIKS